MRIYIIMYLKNDIIHLPVTQGLTGKLHEDSVSIISGPYHIVAGDVEEVLEVLVTAAKQGPH